MYPNTYTTRTRHTTAVGRRDGPHAHLLAPASRHDGGVRALPLPVQHPDPLPPPRPLPAGVPPEAPTFRLRGLETHPQDRVDGWRLLFEMDLSQVPKRTRRGKKDVERRTWGLTSADALRVHDALFGTADAAAPADAVGARVSVLDAVLLVLASVGFHLELRKGSADEGAKNFWDKDRFGYWEGPKWKLGKLEWVGGNLRTVYGVPLKGDKLAMEEVVEDDSDW